MLKLFSSALNAAPERVEIKTKLAETYEVMGQFQKALELINEGAHLPFFDSKPIRQSYSPQLQLSARISTIRF